MRDRNSYTNYKQISTRPNDAEPVADLANEVEEFDKLAKEVDQFKATETEAIGRGKVANCSSLNVREKPEASANVLTIIPVDSEVDVFVNEFVPNKFYHIITSDGKEGYVMSNYIEEIK